MSKILRVNMKDLTCKFEDVPEKYKLFGGRALTSSITCDEVPPTCHPLGPNNKIIIAPGIISGTNAPTSGRISVGGKSPLTGTIKEANSGGLASQKLGKLQIRAIIVEGKPEEKGKFYLLKINKDGAELIPADDLAGKGMYEVDEILGQRYGKIAIIGIGPAGEMMLTNAGVSINDMENRPGRYAGRGGMGAVMGSKGLKAIVIDDEGAPLGRIIGNGTEFTARALGVSRVPTVKGQSMPAYEPRAVKGMGVVYATSTMGADHTSGYTIAPEILGIGGKEDPLNVEKSKLARAFLNTTAFIDSTGYCLFIAFAILDISEGFVGVIETMNGVIGANLSGDDWVNIGKETIDKERAFNIAAGFTSAHDRVPEFMNIEKLPPHNVTFEVSEEILDSVYKE